MLITGISGIIVTPSRLWNIHTVRPIDRMKSGTVKTSETVFQTL